MLRPPYKFIGHLQVECDYTLNPELLGDDRPDVLAAFYARERQSLATGK
jgi:hypothetical protein